LKNKKDDAIISNDIIFFQFNHHIAKFKYPAKVTQSRYGNKRYAAFGDIA